jgi:hypothetical protein
MLREDEMEKQGEPRVYPEMIPSFSGYVNYRDFARGPLKSVMLSTAETKFLNFPFTITYNYLLFKVLIFWT